MTFKTNYGVSPNITEINILNYLVASGISFNELFGYDKFLSNQIKHNKLKFSDI